jgi:hypothetical protein
MYHLFSETSAKLYSKLCSKIFCKLSILILSLLFISCAKEEVNRLQHVPQSATVVVKFNAKSYLQDTFDDYLVHGEKMYQHITKGLAAIILAPDKIGLSSLEDHYFFVENIKGGGKRFGAVVALKSGDALEEYLVSERLEVQKTKGLRFVIMNDSTCLVWDNETAVLSYHTASDQFSEKSTHDLFLSKGWASNRVNETAGQALMNSNAHFAIWDSGGYLISLIELGAGNTEFNVFHDLFYFQDKGSLLEVTFTGNQVEMCHKSYLSKELADTLRNLKKANSISNKIFFTADQRPLRWVSASLSSEELLEKLTKAFELQDYLGQDLSAFLSINELSKYLTGDLFFTDNGVDVREKMIFESTFNEATGSYESGEVKKIVEQKFFTLALGIRDSFSLAEKIKPLAVFLNYDKGVYSFKDLYYFQIKDGVIYIASSPKSQGLFSRKFDDSIFLHAKLGKSNPMAGGVAIGDLIRRRDKRGDLGNSNEIFALQGAEELLFEQKELEEQVQVNEYVVTFNDSTNAVVELTSFLMSFVSKL